MKLWIDKKKYKMRIIEIRERKLIQRAVLSDRCLLEGNMSNRTTQRLVMLKKNANPPL